jgi:hypothetical protein
MRKSTRSTKVVRPPKAEEAGSIPVERATSIQRVVDERKRVRGVPVEHAIAGSSPVIHPKRP